LFVLLLATGVALAEDAPKANGAGSATEAQEKLKKEAQASTKEDPTAKDNPNLGMSILGNQEAPKALVIVPWKRSEIGDALGISTMLDDSRLPIDKEVFMRMLNFYQIRSETAHPGGTPAAGRETAPAGGNAAQPATSAQRRES
jgi:hypothetical protein